MTAPAPADITEKLRAIDAENMAAMPELCREAALEAADEITALRSRVAELEAALRGIAALGINTAELLEHVEALLERAAGEDREEMGAVNWGDLGVADIEYRISILRPEDGPTCVVTVEEAGPYCGLQQWLNIQLDQSRFPNTRIECEW